MDFKYLQDDVSGNWIVSAPRRAKRPSATGGTEEFCPFCYGSEKENDELYRMPQNKEWRVRVIKNAFPFASIHEVIIHSPDHHKTFDELPLSQIQLILETFKNRYNEHADKGSVYIFNNHGEAAGESLPHPHSQLVVIGDNVKLDLPHFEIESSEKTKETDQFTIFAPYQSQWPDEVWVYPKRRNTVFGDIQEAEIKDFSKLIYRLIQLMDLRHGHEFPYNFYIYPYKDWYFRLVPRIKIIGGFEVGTNVFVNTQDPKETIEFIAEHFDNPDFEKIKTLHRAKYHKFS